VTYFRNLGDTVTFDHQAIVNLSSVIRNFAESTRNTFQEVSSKFDLASKLSESAAEIRKLEFALSCLETYIDEYMVAIQTVITGKIPVNINPSILQNILKNISLNLPEGYELIMGSNPYDTESYYEFVHAAMVTNPQGFMLILSIPIKHVYR
jgi:predicted transcriptional regulator